MTELSGEEGTWCVFAGQGRGGWVFARNGRNRSLHRGTQNVISDNRIGEEKEEDRSLPLALAFGENYSALAAMT